MTLFLDVCRGATFSHVRGGEDAVASRALRSVRRSSAQDAPAVFTVARRRRRPSLSPLQLRSCVYTYRVRRLFKSKACHRQFSANQRNLARVPKAAASDAAHGFQLVRQRRQGHQQSSMGPPQVWGSGGNRLRMRTCIVGWVESLSIAGTKRAIVDRAANLEQEIGPLSRPAHLLRFIHSAVHQEIGRPLGDRSPNPQPGTVAFGVIDHPVALASEIAIQRVQGGPQLSRRCASDFRSPCSP